MRWVRTSPPPCSPPRTSGSGSTPVTTSTRSPPSSPTSATAVRRRGGSTITQQLARTLFTGGERTAVRKLRELLYAIEMERTLGKARILELYLNTVDWGPGLCGARSAARAYFGKSPARLTALEAAWLAGVLRNPHDAWDQQFAARQPDRARATQVLMQMRDWPKRQRERFAAQPLAFARRLR